MPDVLDPNPKNLGKELGQSGTLVFQGIISNEEYNFNLTGRLLIDKVEVMRRSSSTVRSTLQVVKLPILGADWKMVAAQDGDGEVTEKDQMISNFCQRELFGRNIRFSDVLRQGLTCLDFGFSIFEKVYDLTTFEGKTYLGLDKLAFRKQSTKWAWQTRDGKPGITQQVSGDTFDIPRDKIIVFVNDKEGDNDDGISLLRYAYKDWDMLDKLTIVNAIALEKMSIGVPIITAREGSTPGREDIKKAESVLRNFRANEESFMDLPGTMQVEMLDMKANSTKEIIPTLNYHDRRISQAILAGFLEIGGQSGSGSQSLSKDLTSLFMKSEEATAKMLQQTFQEDLIKQLVDLNFTDTDNGYPQITFGSISDDDLSVTASALSSLAEKELISPDIDLEAHLRKQFRLPAMSKEAREAYKEKQEASKAATQNLIAPNQPTNDKTLEDDSKSDKVDPKDVKASALEDAKKARRKLIEVTFED